MQPQLVMTPRARVLTGLFFGLVAACYIWIVLPPFVTRDVDFLLGVLATLMAGFIVMYLYAPAIDRGATKARSHLKIIGGGLLITIGTYALATMMAVIFLMIMNPGLEEEGYTMIDAVVTTLYLVLGAPLLAPIFFGYLQLLMALPVGAMTVWLIYIFARRNGKTAA